MSNNLLSLISIGNLVRHFVACPSLRDESRDDDWAGYFIKAIIYKVLPTPDTAPHASSHAGLSLVNGPHPWPLIGCLPEASWSRPLGVD